MRIIALSLALLPAATANANPGFTGDFVQGDAIPRDAFGVHPLDGSFYLESWDHAFRFTSGHSLFVSFLSTNIGAAGTAGVIAVLVKPDSTTLVWRDRRRRGEWNAGADLDIAVGAGRLSGVPPRSHVKLENGIAKLELSLVNATPPVKPGRIDFGSDVYFDVTLHGTRVRANGKLIVGDAEIVLKGEGFVRHGYTQSATHRLFKSWMTTGGFWRNIGFHISAMHTSAGVVPMLIVTEGDKVIVTGNTDIDIRYFKYKRDNAAAGKFRVPGGFRFSFTDKKTGAVVSGRVESKKIVHRFDVLENINKFDRFIIERFQKPIQYRHLVRWKLEITSGKETRKASGEGLSEYNFLN